MNIIETLAYAGLGLANEATDKAKSKFDELVEAGKKADNEGKNYVGDFFKTVDSTKDDFSKEFAKNKEKLEDMMPFLKELEEKFMKAKEDITAKAKETKDDLTSKAKDAFAKKTDSATSTTEEAKVVEETK